MEVKIDTKEKFTVVTPVEAQVSANIAAELEACCGEYLLKPVKNLVLNLEKVQDLDPAAATVLARQQQLFYENSASFVICNLQPAVEALLEQLELLDLMNITPSESEAWDIVQMEEIERELLDGEDIRFDKND